MAPWHFLFLVVGGTGHIFPVLGAVAGLLRAGHRVTVVTSPEFTEMVQAAGASAVSYASPFETLHVPDVMGEADAEERLNEVYVADNEAILRRASEVADADPPDAVAYDVFDFIAGKLLAHGRGVPAIRFWPTFAANDEYSIWNDLQESLDQGGPEDSPVIQQRLGSLFREYGVKTTVRDFWHGIDDFNIVSIPRSFQRSVETFDERFIFTGHGISRDRAETQRWEAPSAADKILLISLGSTWNDHPEFYQKCIEAFRDSDWHVVMTIGEGVEAQDLPDLPDNIEVHAWISFLEVLRHGTVLLTQGSTGAVLEALYRCCPMVVVPDFTAEAEPSASRVVELGLGHRLDSAGVPAEAIRRAVDDVHNDTSVRARVKRIQEEMVAAGGGDKAAEAILSYMQRRAGSADTRVTVTGR